MTTSPPKWVRDVGDADFEREVIERSAELPVVVDFWAPWCQPCQMLGPVLEKLAEEYDGKFLLAKVNVDEAQQVATAFGISGIPDVKAIHEGRVIVEFTGVLPEPDLRKFLDSLVPSEEEIALRESIEAAKNVGDETAFAAAEVKLREALVEAPTNVEVMVALGEILVAKSQFEEVDRLLEAAGDGGDFSDEVSKLSGRLHLARCVEGGPDLGELRATVAGLSDDAPDANETRLRYGCALALGEDYPAALQVLYEAGSADKAFAKEHVREAMVSIFYLAGVRSELSDEYRSKLTSLLY